ncbi:MBOAT family O-acyltransferase [Flavobacterium oreochromis]|uniref:Membrane-bound O-acyltransferase family protein n=1 Tax=Flavobacterium columnare TaxID=996 RepID=A0A246GDJ4_9FLAO|nr:MBOAT family O-acyltransferase [Flavobacterium oreochromis]OWP79343.1 membrane-bound O-acyltransferase family protein [Flavobacterium oreochromis]QYS86444.1 MBOAT family protein [Flavobacterium oreochromis]
MLFNTLDFALFLPLVFILYWFITNNNLKLQNILLLVASYYFYSCWDWRFLFLLIFSTLLDYFTGLKIDKSVSRNKKLFWLWLSIIINAGFLGFFKYYNFFVTEFTHLISVFGYQINSWSLKIILPVGISFYTFHGLSYVIDIYYGRIKAEKNFVDYSLFVSFFPLLVAGPIERATHLLPQIKVSRKFNYHKSVDGLRQILWGLFKKIVIADQCAEMANIIFGNYQEYSSISLIGGAIFFTFQIYGDFSGYSDIALGTARLFGIELLRNFAFPYFSRDIAEFWRRWHISLSSWFKDYLYIPLGGSKGGTLMRVRNTFIIFIVSGFWHGANWTFIVWGLLNALYIIPSIIFKTNRNYLEIVAKGKLLPSLKESIQITSTFALTIFAWIFFRSLDMNNALNFIIRLFSFTEGLHLNVREDLIIPIIIFFLIEWIGRDQEYAIANFGLKWASSLRYTFYIAIIICLFWFGGKEQQFIYFDF